MKNELTVPDHFPDSKEEDLIAAAKRRETYSLARDIQAKEFNEAIVSRLAKNREKEGEDKKQFKCEKCGKDFDISISEKDEKVICPHCKELSEI